MCLNPPMVRGKQEPTMETPLFPAQDTVFRAFSECVIRARPTNAPSLIQPIRADVFSLLRQGRKPERARPRSGLDSRRPGTRGYPTWTPETCSLRSWIVPFAPRLRHSAHSSATLEPTFSHAPPATKSEIYCIANNQDLPPILYGGSSKGRLVGGPEDSHIGVHPGFLLRGQCKLLFW